MAENNPEILNTVYKEISEKLGMDTALEIYRLKANKSAFRYVFLFQ